MSSGVHLSVNLLGFPRESPSTLLSSLEVINFLETLGLMDVGEEVSLVVGVVLNHEFADSGSSVIVLLSASQFADFFHSIEEFS